MASGKSFSLTKWYLDSVDGSGNVFIGYVAGIHWKFARFHHNSSLLCSDCIVTQASISSTATPILDDTGCTISWHDRRLGVGGVWTSIAEPIRCTLLDSEEGSVSWQCLQPASRTSLDRSARALPSGLGYVELLEMTIKPWKLPINELLWGRFVSETDHLVWIVWHGAQPLSLVFHNGLQISSAFVSNDRIGLGGNLVLDLNDQFVLRDGDIGSTALGTLSELKFLLPGKITRVHETKWRSRGVLRESDREISRGWVIHEVVRF